MKVTDEKITKIMIPCRKTMTLLMDVLLDFLPTRCCW
jgi:hypothetical protein